MPTEVASTVANMPGCSNVRDCTLVFHGPLAIHGPYTGVRYHYVGETPAGSRARLEGRTTYEEERFYVLGEVPEHDRVAFVLDDEPNEWYVAGWATEQTVTDPRYRDSHPLGVWFGLHEWTHGRIDDHEDRPYLRVHVEVRYA